MELANLFQTHLINFEKSIELYFVSKVERDGELEDAGPVNGG